MPNITVARVRLMGYPYPRVRGGKWEPLANFLMAAKSIDKEKEKEGLLDQLLCFESNFSLSFFFLSSTHTPKKNSGGSHHPPPLPPLPLAVNDGGPGREKIIHARGFLLGGDRSRLVFLWWRRKKGRPGKNGWLDPWNGYGERCSFP